MVVGENLRLFWPLPCLPLDTADEFRGIYGLAHAGAACTVDQLLDEAERVEGRTAINPPVANPPVANPPVANPPIVNPPIVNPPLTNPPVANPRIVNPHIVNPPVTNPPVVNPPIANPPIGGRFMEEPEASPPPPYASALPSIIRLKLMTTRVEIKTCMSWFRFRDILGPRTR